VSAVDRSWVEVSFGRELDSEAVGSLARAVVSDRRREAVVFETELTPKSTMFRVGGSTASVARVTSLLRTFVPTAVTNDIDEPQFGADEGVWVRRVRLSRATRSLDVSRGESVSRSLLSISSQLRSGERSGERVTVRWVLGPRLAATAVPNRLKSAPADSVGDVVRRAVFGPGDRVDPERRRALADKVNVPGARVLGQIVVEAGIEIRARELVRDVIEALNGAQAPGVSLFTSREPGGPVVRVPRWRWPLSLNADELTTVLGWPFGDAAYPGVDRSQPTPTPPPSGSSHGQRVVGVSTFPGAEHDLALSPADALMHLLVTGPTGVGKSTLLANLAAADIAAGRGVIVIDPKGDLIDTLLRHIPSQRLHDVVLIDPADDQHPVGLNPLRAPGVVSEVVADQVLAVFHGLYRDSWGPRTQDVLHTALLTLLAHPGATLTALPVLLSNPATRRSLTGAVAGDVAVGPFWAWYEQLSAAERSQVIAPVMNKLRAFLLRPRVRAILGQAEPRFDMTTLFTRRRIVLVNLAKGLIGPEASALLGSLVVSQLWAATQQRAAIEPGRRHPVMAYVDEFQDYLHLPTDLADVLAQARGLGLGLTLANQHLDQLTKSMRSAVMANCRSKVCFQLDHDDATVLARHTTGILEARDFEALGRFEIYASLVTNGRVTPFASGRTTNLPTAVSDSATVRAASRERFARPLVEVEAEIARLTQPPGPSDDPGAGSGEVGRRPRRRP